MSMHCLNRTTVTLVLILALVSTVFVAPATAIAGSSCSVSLAGMDPPVCFSPSGVGFKLYFIGGKGVSQGPQIPGVAELAEMNPKGSGNVVVYTGTNPMSGALVVIRYLSDDQLIHVHAGIWDSHHEAFKPIIYVVDGENNATRWEADNLPSLPPAPDEETMASDEETMASDEETMASDEETMASDEETMASDEEMKASDEEMKASDEEMKASDEEMMASEEEMMASEEEEKSTIDQPRGEIDMVALDPATPVEVDTVGSDLVFYLVSADGVVQGPRLPMVARLADKYPEGSGNVVLYTGTNIPPKASVAAPVVITYLSDDAIVHVHTFTWDSHNEALKSYVFVIDAEDSVSFWEQGEEEEN